MTLRRAPPLPALPIERHGRPVCMVTMCFVGDPNAGERALAPLQKLGRPLLDLVDVRPYTGLQSLADATVPHGWHYYWKSANLPPLDDALVESLVDHSSQIRSPWSYAVLFHLGGAVSDVAEDATAYPHRHATHNLNVHAAWLPGQPGGEEEIAWARQFYATVASRSAGTYVSFLDHDDHHRLPAAYGAENYRRLVALADRYDPGGVFRRAHPSGSPPLRCPAPARSVEG